MGRLLSCRAADRANWRSKALDHIAETDALGGMAKAIEAGVPQTRIEEAAARTQARLDSGHQTVVGVNRFRPTEETPIEVLKVDNSAVLAAQVAKLKQLRGRARRRRHAGCAGRAHRCGADRHRQPAGALHRCGARQGDGRRDQPGAGARLRPLRDRGARDQRHLCARHGRRRRWSGSARLIRTFRDNDGRPPRILVAKVGQDGHDRGQKVIASAFADLGFEVDIGPLFQTPEEAAARAIDCDVHIVGVSSLAAGHLTLVPALKRALEAQGRPDIMVVVGGIVPEQDFNALYDAGVSAIFTPGTVISDAAERLIRDLNRRLGYEQPDRANLVV